MVLQHFGLKHFPLGKENIELWDDGSLAHLDERFQWLLDSPGVGLLTGEAGIGKTAALRRLTHNLNPHRYQVIYLAETDFGRVDLYRSLALTFGLEPAYRRAALWRDIRACIHLRRGYLFHFFIGNTNDGRLRSVACGHKPPREWTLCAEWRLIYAVYR
ncbi:hypothetical protein MNBD_GAMMA26-2061 [hydrothermal vent metagenome]|uniref:ORC1/DEAH AAA+ ATPase domain-containing protein n=1 Tax=hydrothermal vent metagenome TaxID=652676 RepID=A0A3B1AVK8_9ZZZZ